MIRIVACTYRLHTFDMFDEMPIMASMGLVEGLFKYLHLNHCFIVIFFSRCVNKLWAMTWALGLKKWLKSQEHNTKKNSPWILACLVTRASKASWTLLGP